MYKLSYIDATIIPNNDVLSDDDIISEITRRYSITPKTITIDSSDGEWIDYTASWTFSDPIAENVAHLLKYCGRMIETFTVTDENNNVVLTEE